MKFQFLPENFSRSENAPPFETRKIRLFEVERIFLENKKMVQVFAALHQYAERSRVCGGAGMVIPRAFRRSFIGADREPDLQCGA